MSVRPGTAGLTVLPRARLQSSTASVARRSGHFQAVQREHARCPSFRGVQRWCQRMQFFLLEAFLWVDAKWRRTQELHGQLRAVRGRLVVHSNRQNVERREVERGHRRESCLTARLRSFVEPEHPAKSSMVRRMVSICTRDSEVCLLCRHL